MMDRERAGDARSLGPHHPDYWHARLEAAFPFTSTRTSLARVPSTGQQLIITAYHGTERWHEAHLLIDKSDDDGFYWIDADVPRSIDRPNIHWKLSTHSGASPAIIKLPDPCPWHVIIRWEQAFVPLNINGKPYQDLGGVLPSIIVTTQDAAVQVTDVSATTIALHVRKMGAGSHQMRLSIPRPYSGHFTNDFTAAFGRIEAVHLLVENNGAVESKDSSDNYALYGSSVTFLHVTQSGSTRRVDLGLGLMRLHGPTSIYLAKGHLKFDHVGVIRAATRRIEAPKQSQVQDGICSILLGAVDAETRYLKLHLPIAIRATGNSVVDLQTTTTSGTLQIRHDLAMPADLTSKTKADFTARVIIRSVAAKSVDITTGPCPVNVNAVAVQTSLDIRTGIKDRPNGVNPALAVGNIDAKSLMIGSQATRQRYHLQAAHGKIAARFFGWAEHRNFTAILEAQFAIDHSGAPSSAKIIPLPEGEGGHLKNRIKIETTSAFSPVARQTRT